MSGLGLKNRSKTKPNLKTTNGKHNTNTSHSFVTRTTIWQSDPNKTNGKHIIYVEMIIHPPNTNSKTNTGKAQKIRFPFEPKKESIESVIDEMIEMLHFNPIYKSQIINAINDRLQYCVPIVHQSPIETNPKNTNVSIYPSSQPKNVSKLSFSSEFCDLDPLSPFPAQPTSLLYRSDSDSNFPNLQKEWSVIEDVGVTQEIIGYDSARDYSYVSNNNNNQQYIIVKDERKQQSLQRGLVVDDDILGDVNVNNCGSGSESVVKLENNGRITPLIQINGNKPFFLKT